MNDQLESNRLLETAAASPAAVAAEDRAAWVGLLSRHAVIEDPVGSRPHHGGLPDSRSGVRGRGPLERFYDTFIAPNEITFHVDHDVVCPPLVIRDITIELGMAAGLTIHVPMHVIYEIVEEDGAPRIAHLRAHWELIPMVRQVLANGWPGITTMTRLGWRMVKNQGLGGIAGFSRGMDGIHGAGKKAVGDFVDAVNRRDTRAAALLFDRAGKGVAYPDGRDCQLPGEAFGGEEVSLEARKLISCGFVTSCSLTVKSASGESRGVAFFEFNSRTRKLHAARIYCS